MPEAFTLDQAADVLVQSITTVQKNQAGVDVTNETRIDWYGAHAEKAMADPAFALRLPAPVKAAINKRVSDRAAAQAAAAAAAAAAHQAP